jgi:hypothetical protein
VGLWLWQTILTLQPNDNPDDVSQLHDRGDSNARRAQAPAPAPATLQVTEKSQLLARPNQHQHQHQHSTAPSILAGDSTETESNYNRDENSCEHIRVRDTVAGTGAGVGAATRNASPSPSPSPLVSRITLLQYWYQVQAGPNNMCDVFIAKFYKLCLEAGAFQWSRPAYRRYVTLILVYLLHEFIVTQKLIDPQYVT